MQPSKCTGESHEINLTCHYVRPLKLLLKWSSVNKVDCKWLKYRSSSYQSQHISLDLFRLRAAIKLLRVDNTLVVVNI